MVFFLSLWSSLVCFAFCFLFLVFLFGGCVFLEREKEHDIGVDREEGKIWEELNQKEYDQNTLYKKLKKKDPSFCFISFLFFFFISGKSPSDNVNRYLSELHISMLGSRSRNNTLFWSFSLFCFKAGRYWVVDVTPELCILLLQFPKCWGYRCPPAHLVCTWYSNIILFKRFIIFYNLFFTMTKIIQKLKYNKSKERNKWKVKLILNLLSFSRHNIWCIFHFSNLLSKTYFMSVTN